MKRTNATISTILSSTFLVWSVSACSQEPTVIWDENVDGDFSGERGSPTMIEITEPGEYIIRTVTGPMIPERLETPGPIRPMLPQTRESDKNGDGLISRDEATANYGARFDTYDINGDGFIDEVERSSFANTGDVNDLFSFVQAPGVNLVAIKLLQFDAGGPHNAGTPLVVIDTDKDGNSSQVQAVGLTNDVSHTFYTNPVTVGHFEPNPDGSVELYAATGLWKYYRRNDDRVYFRLGEGQEKATAELLFVFQ